MAIGVLCSGGDAPGMNACVRAVVRAGIRDGREVLGILRGYAGLIAGQMRQMDRLSVGNIIQRGGTILGTSRSEEFKTPEGRARAIEALRARGVEGLVVIGGEGTFKGARALMDDGGPSCVGVPGTIDNDVTGTDRTIGFDTAVNTALGAIDRIRDTAASHELLHFVEVMGRHSGWIALASGMAGGAEAALVPETATDLDALASSIDDAIGRGKRGVIIVVAEGDETGGAVRLAEEISGRTKRDYRVTILGHLQRGGAPTAIDRILATRLGVAAVETLAGGAGGVMVGERAGRIVRTPLEDAATRTATLDPELVRLIPLLT